MDKFYVGAKVLCVNDKFKITGLIPPIKKGRVYEVLGVTKSNCCGLLLLDVGISYDGNDAFFNCSCGGNPLIINNIWTIRATRFRLIEPDTTLSEVEVNELLDEMNKELTK